MADINQSNYTVLVEGGEGVIPIPEGSPIAYFFYLFKNPVTPVSEIEAKEYYGDKEESFTSFGIETYTFADFPNLQGDNKLQLGDDIEITVRGEVLEDYFFGVPPGKSNPVISFKPPLTEKNLKVQIDSDGFYKSTVVLTRQEEVLTYSKLEYKREAAQFVTSGGMKVVRVIGTESFNLVKMPSNFLIDIAHQTGNENPEPEEWSLTEKPFIPLRARESDVADAPKLPIGAVISFNWADNIAILLDQKY